RSIFAKPNIHLENRSVDWCFGYRFIEIGSRSLESGYCVIEVRLRGLALGQAGVLLLVRAGHRRLGRPGTHVRPFGSRVGGVKAPWSRGGILREVRVACEAQRRSVTFSLGAFEIGACLFDGSILQDQALVDRDDRSSRRRDRRLVLRDRSPVVAIVNREERL